MQKRIGKCCGVPKIRGFAQQVLQWMSRRQPRQGIDKLPNSFIGGANADSSAELLQHIDAVPAVRSVHHKMHSPIGLQHAAKRGQPRIRISKVMENARADNLIEVFAQLVYPFDRKLLNLQIVESISSFEVLGA